MRKSSVEGLAADMLLSSWLRWLHLFASCLVKLEFGISRWASYHGQLRSDKKSFLKNQIPVIDLKWVEIFFTRAKKSQILHYTFESQVTDGRKQILDAWKTVDRYRWVFIHFQYSWSTVAQYLLNTDKEKEQKLLFKWILFSSLNK